MRPPFLRLAPLALSALVIDCRSLPAIPSDTCGNGVVDPGEDCDTFAPSSGTSCRPPSAPAGACRLDCTGGSGHACPPGWGCGTDGICRQPSGSFSRASAPVAADAWRLMTGDFDGDGRQDVLARAAIDVGGYSKLRIHYYGRRSDHSIALAKTLVLAPKVASPALADFNTDGLTDLAFVDHGIDVMLGQANRTLAPVAYPQFTLPQTSVALARLQEYGASPRDDLVLFGQSADGSVVALVRGSTPTRLLTPAGRGPGDLAGEMISAPFVDPATTGCEDLVLAYVHADGADVYTPCTLVGGRVQINDSPPATHVKLPSPLVIDAGIRAGDVDGDGHFDLLLASGPSAFVAYGDGRGHFHDAAGVADQASPVTVAFSDGTSSPLPFPLAVADLNDDGRADYATARGVFVSVPQSKAYAVSATKSPGAWTAARVADMNGDGLLDVVAASAGELDADFFVGTGGLALDPFSIATTGAVSNLAVGDFDGDRVNDVMLAQVAADPSQPDQITIAWGQAFAPPQPPVAVGMFPGIAQALTLRTPGTTLSNLAIVAHPAGAPETALVAMLEGNGDRQPLAPYVLTTTAQTPAMPIALTAGPFLGPGRTDVLALAADVDASGDVTGFRFWLAPSGGPAAELGAPVSSALLPAGFKPLSGASDVASHVAALMGWGHVGAGQAPTAVAAAPGGTGELTSAFLAAHAAQGSPPSVTPGTVQPFGAAVSAEGQMELRDVDGDGHEDMVLLTGLNASADRALVIAWNDGAGRFAAGQALAVSAADESPQGFAFVAVDTSGPPRLAYATRKSVVLATVDPASRTVSARQTIDTAASATGLAAGDVDGDGVEDLALADQGDVVILRDAPVLE